MIDNNKKEPIDILSGSIVVLHRNLKMEDKAKIAYRKHGDTSKTEPLIAIDLAKVFSVQEDFKGGGTLIVDEKGSVAVIESFADILDAWLEVRSSHS